jgi:hypothetical protein
VALHTRHTGSSIEKSSSLPSIIIKDEKLRDKERYTLVFVCIDVEQLRLGHTIWQF